MFQDKLQLKASFNIFDRRFSPGTNAGGYFLNFTESQADSRVAGNAVSFRFASTTSRGCPKPAKPRAVVC